jgi:hypothetical protein
MIMATSDMALDVMADDEFDMPAEFFSGEYEPTESMESIVAVESARLSLETANAPASAAPINGPPGKKLTGTFKISTAALKDQPQAAPAAQESKPVDKLDAVFSELQPISTDPTFQFIPDISEDEVKPVARHKPEVFLPEPSVRPDLYTLPGPTFSVTARTGIASFGDDDKIRSSNGSRHQSVVGPSLTMATPLAGLHHRNCTCGDCMTRIADQRESHRRIGDAQIRAAEEVEALRLQSCLESWRRGCTFCRISEFQGGGGKHNWQLHEWPRCPYQDAIKEIDHAVDECKLESALYNQDVCDICWVSKKLCNRWQYTLPMDFNGPCEPWFLLSSAKCNFENILLRFMATIVSRRDRTATPRLNKWLVRYCGIHMGTDADIAANKWNEITNPTARRKLMCTLKTPMLIAGCNSNKLLELFWMYAENM